MSETARQRLELDHRPSGWRTGRADGDAGVRPECVAPSGCSLVEVVVEKGIAARIVTSILAAEREVGALDTLSQSIPDEQERLAFRRKLGGVMTLYIEMLMSIVQQHPELDPDKPSAAANDAAGGPRDASG